MNFKNIKENKRDKTFTVQLPTGKVKVYKTLKGAENCVRRNNITIDLPSLFTANCYFWSPQGSASGRRSNERRHEATIKDFFALVLVPTADGSGVYYETCGNVYKSIRYCVRRNSEWKNTNLTGFIGECAQWGVEIRK